MEEKEHLSLYGPGPMYVGIIGALTAAWLLADRFTVISEGRLHFFRVPLIVLGALFIAAGIYMWIQAVIVSRLDDRITEGNLVTDGIYRWFRNPIYHNHRRRPPLLQAAG